MISKCLLVLAVALQITAYKGNQDVVMYAKSGQQSHAGYEYSYQSPAPKERYQRVYAAAEAKSTHAVSGTSSQHQSMTYKRPQSTSAPILRNLVARGKYPVALQTCGPLPEKKIPIMTSHIRVPVQEKPTVRLPSRIPAPKTIAHTCTCYKTIVKPRVQQHIITVPSIHRYIETTHRPVIENIYYEGQPIRCEKATEVEVPEEKPETSSVQSYQVQTAEVPRVQTVRIPQVQVEKLLGVETFEVPSIRVREEAPKVQRAHVVEIPRLQFVEEKKRQAEVPRVQYLEARQPHNMELPRVQYLEEKKPDGAEVPHDVELPRVQFVESQKAETFEIPRVHFGQDKKAQAVELRGVQFGGVKPQTLDLPRVEFLTQKLQTVEIPRIQLEESAKVETPQAQHQSGSISLGAGPFSFRFSQ